MQNIIDKIQTGDISNNQLLQQLTTYNDKTVDEFNEVVDKVEELSDSLESQNNILVKQHAALLKQDNDKKIFQANEESLKKQSVAYQLENQTLKRQIVIMKKDTKAIKEQVTRLKASSKLRDSKIKKLEKAKASKKDTKMDALDTIYCKNQDVLVVYPAKLLLGFEDSKQQQVVLLYTDRKGCFVTCFLNSDNEAAFSSFIDEDAGISDQTRKLINKNTLQVPDDVAEFAQQWLYRINVIQKMEINAIDLVCVR